MNYNFFKKILQYITLRESYLLAFSGGLDSTVLLDILSKYSKFSAINLKNNQLLNIRVIHINHHINQNSSDWENHCYLQCLKYQVPFQSISITIKNFSEGIEASARNARYKALFNNLKPKEILLTAHHQNDQIETFFLLLKRGSGPLGLSGMQSHMKYKNYSIRRPLLLCKKHEIHSYAIKNKLKWIEDPSNTDTKHDRNFLRIQVIPVLLKRWPHLGDAISRTTKICFAQERLLYKCFKRVIDSLIFDNGSLNFTKLLNMSQIERNFILRSWFKKNYMRMPSVKQLNYIWNNIVLSKIDSKAVLKIQKKIIKRFRNKLYFISDKLQSPNKNISLTITKFFNVKKIHLPSDLGILFIKSMVFNSKLIEKLKLIKNKNTLENQISCDLKSFLNDQLKFNQKNIFYLKKNIYITITRYPYIHEKVFIKFKNTQNVLKQKSVSKKLRQNSIPPWKRNFIPLLFYNNDLISALGAFITPSGYIKKNDRVILFYWKNKTLF
ncbi:MAG: tRNA(Ile)-lysidine synthetase [Wigglesworthia glossinidia]|nr:tRNA(Ile)-lysidine synthetase [Wigglesworthia glossinidia]